MLSNPMRRSPDGSPLNATVSARPMPLSNPSERNTAMSADYFAEFSTVRYEGPQSKNELAYRWYDKDRMVLGKRMEDHLRFAICFWHTFGWQGSDVFGAGTFSRPWHAGANDAAAAKAKREAALAFVEKLDVPFYCFHDVDVMADAEDATSFRRSFAEAVDHLETLQAQHGRKLL